MDLLIRFPSIILEIRNNGIGANAREGHGLKMNVMHGSSIVYGYLKVPNLF